MSNLQKKVLITGATRGIGKSMAETLFSQDYQIIGTATSDEGVESLNSKGFLGIKLDLNLSLIHI